MFVLLDGMPQSDQATPEKAQILRYARDDREGNDPRTRMRRVGHPPENGLVETTRLANKVEERAVTRYIRAADYAIFEEVTW